MSIADTQKARLYANRAEVAAAQCQIYTDEARRAPEYTDLAKQYAEIAEASEEAATIAAQSAQQSSNSASSDASNAIQASSEAQNARDSAVSSAESASSSATSASDSEEIAQQSALSASESAATAAAAVSKTIRVNDTDISPIPDVASRANKVLSFDASGNPIATTPSSGSAADVLNELAAPGGVSLVSGAVSESNLLAPSAPSMIGVMPQGNLSQLLIYVTPEQFGAIGDGTVHPLSERYSTLAAAQAVYPFVTALTQTIDWAACQAADNYARGKCEIRVAKFKKYQLGDNYLKLGPYSCWIAPPLNDFVWDTGFIRNVPDNYSSYAFGQLCIVRVGDASDFTGDGVTGNNVRNITFKGFQLRWDVARHTPSKGIGTICLHMNNAMKMNLDVCLYGGEFAAFGYSCWGTQGSIKMDSCHKGIYWDAVSKTPEKSTEGGSTTSHNIELQIDHTIFPVYLRNCNYAKFHGWFEGALTSMAHYDSVNETAMGITLDSCDGVIFDMGVEAWQGAVLNCIGSVEANISFGMLPGEVLPDGLGTQGVAYRVRSLMSLPDETAIQTTNRSFTYVNGYSTVTINHFIPAVSNWPTGQSTKYVTSVDTTSKITFQDCGLYLGGAHSLGGSDARLKLAPANFANIEAIGGMYIDRYLKPSSSYDYAGKSVSVHNSWRGATIAADGTVAITAPANFKIVDFTAMVGVSANTQPSGVGIKSSSDTSIVLQTTANASYGINYKLWVKPTL